MDATFANVHAKTMSIKQYIFSFINKNTIILFKKTLKYRTNKALQV